MLSAAPLYTDIPWGDAVLDARRQYIPAGMHIREGDFNTYAPPMITCAKIR